MSRGLTLEQMAFLVSKGVTAKEMLAFAQMGAGRSKGAERTARWRAKKNGSVTETVTSDVTCDGHSDASPPPNDIYSNPPVSSDDETIPPARRTRVQRPVKPDGVQDQTWADFVDLRKQKRAPLTETALASIKREAAKAGWTLEDALAKCLARGWQGFEADWLKPDERKPANQTGAVDPLIASILAKKAREASG